MIQKSINTFIDEIYSKPPKKNYLTNKTDVYHIDDAWSLYILDLKNYRPEKKKKLQISFIYDRQFREIGLDSHSQK